MARNRSLPVKSRTGFLSHRECMEEEYEYANELVKQGAKNPRQVPKFTIILERFSHAIEKNIYIDAHAIRANLNEISLSTEGYQSLKTLTL